MYQCRQGCPIRIILRIMVHSDGLHCEESSPTAVQQQELARCAAPGVYCRIRSSAGLLSLLTEPEHDGGSLQDAANRPTSLESNQLRTADACRSLIRIVDIAQPVQGHPCFPRCLHSRPKGAA
eukprot:747081-Pleurochrysis_carterae.AAC.2